jgi:hypothetical protein
LRTSFLSSSCAHLLLFLFYYKLMMWAQGWSIYKENIIIRNFFYYTGIIGLKVY